MFLFINKIISVSYIFILIFLKMEEEIDEKTELKKHILPPPSIQPNQISETSTDTETENQTSFLLLRTRRRTQIDLLEKKINSMTNSNPSSPSTQKTDQDSGNSSSDSNEESTFIENENSVKMESDVEIGTLNETELEENESDTNESKPDREVPIKRRHKRGGYGSAATAGKKRKLESTFKDDQQTPPSRIIYNNIIIISCTRRTCIKNNYVLKELSQKSMYKTNTV